MSYTIEEIEEMKLEAGAIADLILATEKLLLEEQEKRLVPEENIVFIDRSLVNEFARARQLNLKFPQVISLFHDWATRTYELARKNRGYLRHGSSVREHVETNLDVVRLVTAIFADVDSSTEL